MMPSSKKRTASVADFLSDITKMNGNVSQIDELTQYDDSNLWPDIGSVKESESIETKEKTTIEVFSSEFLGENEAFVDLGLSVKWASRNMGADKVTDSGNYFEGVERNSLKNWNTVPEDFGGSNYDPVTNCLGVNYRMPTRSEWKELINKCKWNWGEIDGVEGYIITASNGNSIFLPYVRGYWSCTKGESQDFQCVYYLFFNSYDIDLVYNVYTILRCIRPVQMNL